MKLPIFFSKPKNYRDFLSYLNIIIHSLHNKNHDTTQLIFRRFWEVERMFCIFVLFLFLVKMTTQCGKRDYQRPLKMSFRLNKTVKPTMLLVSFIAADLEEFLTIGRNFLVYYSWVKSRKSFINICTLLIR